MLEDDVIRASQYVAIGPGYEVTVVCSSAASSSQAIAVVGVAVAAEGPVEPIQAWTTCGSPLIDEVPVSGITCDGAA